MSEQLELEKLHELYAKWQSATSKDYSIDMFFRWVDDKIKEGE